MAAGRADFTSGRAGVAVLALALAAILLMPPGSARAVNGDYDLMLLRISFADAAAPVPESNLLDAEEEIEAYFRDLSYGNLRLDIRVASVTLSGNRSTYRERCARTPRNDGLTERSWCPASRLVSDAGLAAANNGTSFAGVDGIIAYDPVCGPENVDGDITWGADAHVDAPVDADFDQAFVHGCGLGTSTPGPSLVEWGSMAHEIGHMLQDQDNLDFSRPWSGHPAGYGSGFNLMDSCYPCGESMFGLSTDPINTAGRRKVFPGWLPEAKVERIPAPASGGPDTSRTVVLAPLGEQPSAPGNPPQGFTPPAKAIKVEMGEGRYYEITARRRLGADAQAQRLTDEGVFIREVEESRNSGSFPYPVRDITPCNYQPDGCLSGPSDPRAGNCNNTPRPRYCWPFDLWHRGEVFTDTANNVTIRVEDVDVGNGFAVTVTRGAAPGRPDLFVLPWLTPPANTWESNDIWVDSSCNGYESDGGELRYGRRPASEGGGVVGNGDDPCANHANRLYVRVHNGGDRPATNVRVRFQVTNPLGVGIRGARGWSDVGTATSTQFATLRSLAPGATADVYVPWTPRVSGLGRSEHFAFHSCVRVLIDQAEGEIVTSNQDGVDEQENFANFEAVSRIDELDYRTIRDEFFIRNSGLEKRDVKRQYFLDVESALPDGWTHRVNRGNPTVELARNATARVPVTIKVPDGTPAGQAFNLAASAQVAESITNELVPSGVGSGPTHAAPGVVGGVVMEARTVIQSRLSLEATRRGSSIVVSGRLTPAHRTRVAIDYRVGNRTVTHVVRTNKLGRFSDRLRRVSSKSKVRITAFWQGDEDHSGTQTATITR